LVNFPKIQKKSVVLRKKAMKPLSIVSCLFFSFLFYNCVTTTNVVAQNPDQSAFAWPDGKKVAISLSFDDARLSNIDVGLPLFKKHGVQVTYYVVTDGMKPRMAGWKQAVKDGHEIGNHTIHHPCTGNFQWSRNKALEEYTLDMMRSELIEANQQIETLLGVTPVSFAYTCGQNYVGRGLDTRSYVPLIAELFTSGRGWLDENVNDPEYADFAQLLGMESDGKDFEKDILPLIEQATASGSWLLLAGHEIGTGGHQTTRVDMLEKLIQYAQDPKNGIWLAPVGTIADYVKKERKERHLQELKTALTFCATFDNGFDADFAKGNKRIYTAPSYDSLSVASPGMKIGDVQIVRDQGIHGGDAVHFKKKTRPVIFYPSMNNINYDQENWEGTISLWLKLNPEKDLAPGYTDPIQITDSGYNDAAFWVDFSNKNPRTFRMGIYGDVKIWNPDNVGPDDDPNFQNRLLTAKDRPFSREQWTHVVFSFKGLNTTTGSAHFFIDGKYQGQREIKEPFTWDYAQSKIFLGLNYQGMLDEVSIFNKALSMEEVKTLYQLENGLKSVFK